MSVPREHSGAPALARNKHRTIYPDSLKETILA